MTVQQKVKKTILNVVGKLYLASRSEKVWHTRRGMTMKYPPGSMGGTTVVQRILGVFEPKVFSQIRRLIRPGMTTINLGACYGDYTVYMAKLVGEQGRVYAFEPMPYFFDLLKINMKLNKINNVQLINQAVGDKEGHLMIKGGVTDPYHSLSQILPIRYPVVPDQIERRTLRALADRDTKIPIVTLSSFLNSHDIKPDLILMDIEGFELQVLTDLTMPIKNQQYTPLILVETHDQLHDRENFWQAINNFLGNCNYTSTYIDPSHYLLRPDVGQCIQSKNTIKVKTDKYECHFYNNGVVHHLSVGGSDNLIPNSNGWGCELGNWYSFFSQLKYLSASALTHQNNGTEFHFEFPVVLAKQSHFRVSEKLTFKPDSITQQFVFKVMSSRALIGDLVNRFVIRGDTFSHATMLNRTISHHSSNIYYQIPTTNVSLHNNHLQLTFQGDEVAYNNKLKSMFEEVVYTRDEPATSSQSPSWVVHYRLLARRNRADNYVLRWFYPNFVLPNRLAQIATWGPLKNWLWRLKEKWPPSPIQLGGSITAKRGDTFTLRSRLDIKKIRLV